jgi:hypothetical protein
MLCSHKHSLSWNSRHCYSLPLSPIEDYSWRIPKTRTANQADLPLLDAPVTVLQPLSLLQLPSGRRCAQGRTSFSHSKLSYLHLPLPPVMLLRSLSLNQGRICQWMGHLNSLGSHHHRMLIHPVFMTLCHGEGCRESSSMRTRSGCFTARNENVSKPPNHISLASFVWICQTRNRIKILSGKIFSSGNCPCFDDVRQGREMNFMIRFFLEISFSCRLLYELEFAVLHRRGIRFQYVFISSSYRSVCNYYERWTQNSILERIISLKFVVWTAICAAKHPRQGFETQNQTFDARSSLWNQNYPALKIEEIFRRCFYTEFCVCFLLQLVLVAILPFLFPTTPIMIWGLPPSSSLVHFSESRFIWPSHDDSRLFSTLQIGI